MTSILDAFMRITAVRMYTLNCSLHPEGTVCEMQLYTSRRVSAYRCGEA